MPLYEYFCRECGKTFELLRRFQDADRDLVCPDCRSAEVQRQLSTFSAGGCRPTSGGGFT